MWLGQLEPEAIEVGEVGKLKLSGWQAWHALASLQGKWSPDAAP